MMLKVSGAILINDLVSGTDVVATLYPALPRVDVDSLPGATAEHFAPLTHLRFDTVNACNLSCVFCHSDFSATAKQLPLNDLRTAISYPMPKLVTISVGCAYEPLMGRYFEQYPTVLHDLRGRAHARIITNGLLLHRKDIGSWADFGLDYIHASVHSHIPDVYERTVRNAGDLRQVTRNLKDVKQKHHAKIRIVNVISKINNVDVPGFCRWAFDELGVDMVDLYRAVFSDDPLPGYPAASYLPAAISELKRSPVLTDDEWLALLESCSAFLDDGPDRVVRDLNADVAVVSCRRSAASH